MEKKPLISVIVPVYNVEEYLPRCVDSILAQTYENLEIILVDDGTKDNAGLICDQYAQKDARIKVIHKTNGGLSSARNAGIDIAQGDYLAFVDSDDWIEPDAYEVMLTAARKYDVKLVCAGRYDMDGEQGEKITGLCPEKEEVISGAELVRRMFTWNHIDSAAWDKLYHRDLFREIRYPVGRVCEDVPTTYKIALDAGNVAMYPKPIYNYFHRPGSITMSSISEKTFHFSQHTAAVYADIREHYPEITDAARYLRVRSLYHILITLDLTDDQTRMRFSQQYDHSRRELKKHTGFFLRSALFDKQEKLTNLLLVLGFYRPLRRIYHKIK